MSRSFRSLRGLLSSMPNSSASMHAAKKPRKAVLSRRLNLEPLEDRTLLSLTLVNSGSPASTIVLAKDPTVSAAYAAIELQTHIQQISGATVPIVTDEMPVTGTPILVGESASTIALGYDNNDFSTEEYRIDFGTSNLMLIGRDFADKANTGSMVSYSNPTWITGRYGNAMRYDGDDMVNADAPTGIAGFDDAAGTLETWVRFSSVSGDPTSWIIHLPGADGSYHCLTRTSTNQVRYLVYTPSQGYRQVISSALTPGTWYHISATHDVASGGRIELFLNGQSQGYDGYTVTQCEGRTINIGAYSPGGGTVAYGFKGDLDEIRLSSNVRNGYTNYQDALSHAPYADTSTLLMTHLDSSSGAARLAYIPSRFNLNNVPLPGFYKDVATCYAVYDFLEEYCGVRWFNPTETGTYYPSTSSIVITNGVDVQRSPNMSMRVGGETFGDDVGTYDAGYDTGAGSLWGYSTTGYNNYMASAYPAIYQQYTNQTDRDNAVGVNAYRFLFRQRSGGADVHLCTHSLESYYQRFYACGSGSPDYHPDWFAYPGVETSQLVYSNTGVIAQVAADAAAYYNSHSGETNVAPFSLEAMDNGNYAPGDIYNQYTNPNGWTTNNSGYFSNGSASNYWFNFVNQVVNQLHAMPGHANDRIVTLAYFTHAAPPTNVTLDPSVEVQFCFAQEQMVYDTVGHRQEEIYAQAWKTEQANSGRELAVWLYPMWPWEYAMDPIFGQNGKCFPGFYAHDLADDFNLLGDSYRGAYYDGWGYEVESYLRLKLMDDPTQNVDVLLSEYFNMMYGPAAVPMQNFYKLVESVYSNPANYPSEVALENDPTPHHQTDVYAWGWLGTQDRMTQLQSYITQATTAAGTNNPYRTRVDLFNLGVWSYMQAGQQAYAAKTPPTTSISSPSGGTVYNSPVNVTINATASDNGSISQVRFYEEKVSPAKSITIPGADFETSTSPWATSGTAGVIPLPFDGMEVAGHGLKIAYINGNSQMQQVLSGSDAVVKANTKYTLSIDVGKPGGHPEYYSAPSIKIVGYSGTGWVELGAATYLANSEPDTGEWSIWVLTWATDAAPAALGMPLAVILRVDSPGVQTLFDNVRLEAIAATVIPVPNGDFESSPSSDPWIYAGASGALSLPYEGMDATGHGSKIAYVNGSYQMRQVLSGADNVIKANTTYTLSVDVGKPGTHPSYYYPPSFRIAGYNISTTNWVELGTATYLANPEPAAGKWGTWVLTWTTDSAPAALGLPIGIIIQLNSSGIQTLFDNVRLDAVPATTIPIPNGDFEATPDPWTYAGNAGAISLPYDGMETAGHGSKSAYVNGGYQMRQVPSGAANVVKANTTYTLSVDVGKPGGHPDYYAAPSIRVAGYNAATTDWVDLGAATYLAHDEPDAGEWSTWVLRWTTGVNPPALGMPLSVLIRVDSPGIQTLFDNVRLEASAAPESMVLLGTDSSSPYSFTWNNAPVGTHLLRTVAIDNSGLATTSSNVSIRVNAPPTVSLVSPSNNLMFVPADAASSIPLSATAGDIDGTVSAVAFYQGATKIADGTYSNGSWNATWNLSAFAYGDYTVTAKATDNNGAITTSTVLNLTLAGSPTNQAVDHGQTATFTVAHPVGAARLQSYQWQKYNTGTSTWDNIAGATAAYYTTAVTSQTDNGSQYRVLGTKAGGSYPMVSAVASLYVNYALEGWWKLDENSGTMAADASGMGHTGTLYNGGTWASTGGIINGTLTFDGSDSHVRIPSTTALKYTGGELSLSTWACINSTDANGGYLISKPWNTSTGEFNYRLGFNSSRNITFSLQGSSPTAAYTITSPSAVTSNAWHHITATVNIAGLMKIYVDGTEVVSGTHNITAWTPTDTSQPLVLGSLYPYGAGSYGSSTLDGKMDNVRLYPHVLSPEAVAEQARAPIGFWKFNETSGSPLDSSGNGYTGTLTNGAAFNTGGMFNGAVLFDGTDSYVSVASVNALKYKGDGLSIGAWVYINSTETNGAYLISKPWNTSTGQFNYGLSINSSRNAIFSLQGTTTSYTLTSPGTIATGGWHHVAATVDSSKAAKLYIDGVQVNSGTHAITAWAPTDSNVPLVIGSKFNYAAGSYGSTSLDGKMDNVFVYDRTLNATDVHRLAIDPPVLAGAGIGLGLTPKGLWPIPLFMGGKTFQPTIDVFAGAIPVARRYDNEVFGTAYREDKIMDARGKDRWSYDRSRSDRMPIDALMAMISDRSDRLPWDGDATVEFDSISDWHAIEHGLSVAAEVANATDAYFGE